MRLIAARRQKIEHRRRAVALLTQRQIVDLATQAILTFEQLAELRGRFISRENPLTRLTQLAHDVDQRNTIKSAGQLVELIGCGRIIQRPQLLHLAKADREDIAEDGFIQAPEDGGQLLRREHDTLGVRNNRIARSILRVMGSGATVDVIRAAVARDANASACLTAMRGGKVTRPTLPGEAVQHRPHELHQGCLASLVRAVEYGYVAREIIDVHLGPNAEPANVHIGYFHVPSS